jgi:hypothetical protein
MIDPRRDRPAGDPGLAVREPAGEDLGLGGRLVLVIVRALALPFLLVTLLVWVVALGVVAPGRGLWAIFRPSPHPGGPARR